MGKFFPPMSHGGAAMQRAACAAASASPPKMQTSNQTVTSQFPQSFSVLYELYIVSRNVCSDARVYRAEHSIQTRIEISYRWWDLAIATVPTLKRRLAFCRSPSMSPRRGTSLSARPQSGQWTKNGCTI